MRSLGDWLARDVITVAKVTEGDKTLEDLGIMGLETGQHIVKCADVEPLQDAVSAELWELACDMLRCIHADGCDGCEWFKDDECSLHLAERYEKFGIEVD